jgi:CBS domain-containing protein
MMNETTTTTVADIMSTPVLTRQAGDLVGDVRDQMLESGLHCLPIVDDDGAPMGIVSAWDLVEEYQPMEAIASAMTRRVVTIGADESVREAASEMRNNFVHHLVVVDEAGGVVGVLSSMDLVAHFVDD